MGPHMPALGYRLENQIPDGIFSVFHCVSGLRHCRGLVSPASVLRGNIRCNFRIRPQLQSRAYGPTTR